VKVVVPPNGRGVSRLAVAGSRLVAEHDGGSVSLYGLDGACVWNGSASSFLVDPAGLRMLVWGDRDGRERLSVVELADGRVVGHADSTPQVRAAAFDGARVAWTAYAMPFDWGELDLWQIGDEPRELVGELGNRVQWRSSATTS
jgi:hypothetical protein